MDNEYQMVEEIRAGLNEIMYPHADIHGVTKIFVKLDGLYDNEKCHYKFQGTYSQAVRKKAMLILMNTNRITTKKGKIVKTPNTTKGALTLC